MTSTSSSLTLPAALAAPHLAGILGDGQSALAALLRLDGADVSGCDVGGKRGSEKQGALRDHLAQLGIPISAGHDPAHLPGGMTALVYSAAIPAGHAELDAARRLGRPVLRRHRALSLYASLFGQVVAVAGGAGKTSTSAVLAVILTGTSWQPTACLGARSPNLGSRNYLHGARRLLIAEADEYRDAFLDLPERLICICQEALVARRVKVRRPPGRGCLVGSPVNSSGVGRRVRGRVRRGGRCRQCRGLPGGCRRAGR